MLQPINQKTENLKIPKKSNFTFPKKKNKRTVFLQISHIMISAISLRFSFKPAAKLETASMRSRGVTEKNQKKQKKFTKQKSISQQTIYFLAKLLYHKQVLHSQQLSKRFLCCNKRILRSSKKEFLKVTIFLGFFFCSNNLKNKLWFCHLFQLDLCVE